MIDAVHQRFLPAQEAELALPRALQMELESQVDELRKERYAASLSRSCGMDGLLRRAYYTARPLLPTGLRRHLQRRALGGWQDIAFPAWPVDTTVDELLDGGLLRAMHQVEVDAVPFVWFWPDAKQGCVMLTHDVETARGRDYTSSLIDIERRFGFIASYEVVPERRYEVPPEYLQSIWDAGCEVCVHDLNHDGRLFSNQSTFRARVALINEYGRRFGARGFRSAVMYRCSEWMHELAFSYDMSFPNVAHLDPQRGGCCTVFPYFNSHVLELPLTTTQDYTLLNVLDDASLELWREQADLVLARHGLLSFIVHPDYVIDARGKTLHRRLLEWLGGLVRDRAVWSALPGEVDRWWRARSAMRVVRSDGRWIVEGDDAARATVAWARESDGVLVLEL